MREISLVLFDLNGVLYNYDRAARIAHLASISGTSAEAIMAAIWESGFEDAGDAGMLDAADYLSGFGARIGRDVSETDWLAAQQAAVTPISATLEVLPRIRNDVRFAILTNNNLLVLRHFSTLYPEVTALASGKTYVSAEFRARKPDPDVYRRCLIRLGVAPQQTLFIDDSPANLAGADVAGLQGYLYTGSEDLSTGLAARGLIQ